VRLREDRGSYVVEFAVIFPAFLLLMFGGIQAALFFHARNVALSAAQTGVDHGRLRDAGAGKGVQSAHSFVNQQGGGVLKGVSVSSAGSNAQTVRVTVSGEALSIIPFIPLRVSQTAAGPVERFTSPGQP
jgi:Flp pilus assembly protein TadG